MKEFQGHGDPLLTEAVKNVGIMVGGVCNEERHFFEGTGMKGGQGDPLLDATQAPPVDKLGAVKTNLEVHKHHWQVLNEIDHRRQSKNLESCIEEHKHHWQLLDELEHLPKNK